ncbi:MAG: ATP synthase F0 subunit B [Candidatus Aminicenantes bacterium]|jgi:F-type H+-transporting ATPase subunit b|nr:ATP synthase F0 subunit B [Candidatus Aminicenantes bacterium]
MLSIDLTFAVIFLLVWVLVLILSKVFFKPVGRMMEERGFGSRENREAARKALDAYAQGLRKIEEDLKEAKAASDRIREALETEALKERSRLLSDLNTESRRQVEKARAEINGEVDRLKSELAGEAERLAGEVERKVLN